MESNLLEITVQKLLEKFGKGEHKPGSGSAAAFQGMISTQLLITVISLTCDEKRGSTYKSVVSEMQKISQELEDKFFPKLTDLFIKDSIQFDKTIKSRFARDEEDNKIEKSRLNRESLEELKISINIPWHIAQTCITVCENAAYVFDNGFRSARGDSQVALSGAVSALGGCISIIRLNLLSFKSDEYKYISKVLKELVKLENEYNRLNKLASSKIEVLKIEVENKIPFYKDTSEFIEKYKSANFLSDKDIEQCANDLQKLALSHKDSIWPNQISIDALQILNPETILKKVLGYNYHVVPVIDIQEESGERFEVAGLINQDTKLVLISNEFDLQTQSFTAAHELGHAILHTQAVLHRDVPINSVGQYRTRNQQERQADKFASYFLMPEKTVREVFFQLFSTNRFILNEDTALFLTKVTLHELRQKCKTKRHFARIVSSSEWYSYESFPSLSNVFGVSVEAMAIRLEELDLFEFTN
jgi:Zn-dependent peptidase ImmA (M78 family)/formiminotetrahydrofolate cyclodeaminase